MGPLRFLRVNSTHKCNFAGRQQRQAEVGWALLDDQVKGALMRTYTQLTREQRYQIYALKKMGH